MCAGDWAGRGSTGEMDGIQCEKRTSKQVMVSTWRARWGRVLLGAWGHKPARSTPLDAPLLFNRHTRTYGMLQNIIVVAVGGLVVVEEEVK